MALCVSMFFVGNCVVTIICTFTFIFLFSLTSGYHIYGDPYQVRGDGESGDHVTMYSLREPSTRDYMEVQQGPSTKR